MAFIQKISFVLTIIIIAPLMYGCSGVGAVVEPDNKPANVVYQDDENDWNWGYWMLRFSEDHTRVEAVPIRQGEYHYCVTKFLEDTHCPDCITIGKPEVQPDSTVKLQVTLKHPFSNTPRYTGFDVRGMVYFPPTVDQVTTILYQSRLYYPEGHPSHGIPHSLFQPNPNFPLKFSRAEDGGGELLNTDGYSCYLIPGLTYSQDWPIYSYEPAKQGNEPTPQTTVTPYKLFASANQRRMFLVSDIITREYHFALPPGEFNFGYAVDASWWPADNIPVTNPDADFPIQANAEDPWLIEFEQLLPVKVDSIDKQIFKTIIHHRGTDQLWVVRIYVWNITSKEWDEKFEDFYFQAGETNDEYTSEGYYTLTQNWWGAYGGYEGFIYPGHHFGLLLVGNWDDADPKREMAQIYAAQFVDIYVEE